MDRPRRILRTFALAVLLTGAGLFSAPSPAGAQLISNPFLAAYVGRTNTDFGLGFGQQQLDWRGIRAIEFGFDTFGMTVSPGYTEMDRAQWVSDGQTLYMKLHSIYVNIGAREPNGLYFAGGLNYTIWDEMPSKIISGEPDVLSADPEIGFQGFLGFQVSMERLPFRVVVEAGYAQFSGNVTGIRAGEPYSTTVASTGPIVRVGLVLAKPPR